MESTNYVDIIDAKMGAYKTICCGYPYTIVRGKEVCDYCGKNVQAELVFHFKALIQEQADKQTQA